MDTTQKKPSTKPAWAVRAAHAITTFCEEKGISPAKLKELLGVEDKHWRTLLNARAMLEKGDVTYAVAYLYTDLPALDPRTIPPRTISIRAGEGKRETLPFPRAWTKTKWERWLETPQAKRIAALEKPWKKPQDAQTMASDSVPATQVAGTTGGILDALLTDFARRIVAETQQPMVSEASRLAALAADMQSKMVDPSEIVEALRGELNAFREELLASIGSQLAATVLSQIKAEQAQVAVQYRDVLHRECSDVAQAIISVLETNIGPVVKLDPALEEMIAEEVAKLRVQKEEEEEKAVGVTNLAFRLQAALMSTVDADDADRARFLDSNGDALRELLPYIQNLIPDSRATNIGWLSRRLLEQLQRVMAGSPEDREDVFQRYRSELIELWPLVDKLSMAWEKRERAIQADQVGTARNLFHADSK